MKKKEDRFNDDAFGTYKKDTLLKYLIEEIYEQEGINFQKYKKNTLYRRLEKRIKALNFNNIEDYVTFLKNNETEKKALADDFLIGFTSFFRDEEAFVELKAKVIPALCNPKDNNDMVRLWVVGCSTGEEAYTLAMLLEDYITQNNFTLKYKIFATDVDNKALALANIGTYKLSFNNQIPKAYLERFFTQKNNFITVRKELRQKIVFSYHDILSNPPFIKMDLVTCRNLLIYINGNEQKQIVSNFLFALKKQGYLFLGNSETLGDVSHFFETINAKWKIFKKKTISNLNVNNSIPAKEMNVFNPNSKNTSKKYANTSYKNETEVSEAYFVKYLNKKHSPDTIFINKDFTILYINGKAGTKLSHQEGVFETNLLKIVSADLATMIRAAVKKATKENTEVVIKDITTTKDNQTFVFDLTVYKTKEPNNLLDIYVIEFSPETKADTNTVVIKDYNLDSISKQYSEELENELNQVKVDLQNAVEELEVSNEELQSSNEELMASNEELQSTNEELQSVNSELESLNYDIVNLLNSTDIGTLFLDTELHIRKFTPAIQKHFNIQTSDIGRPLASFASNFSDEIKNSIIKDTAIVLKKHVSREKEITDLDGNVFLKRMLPFTTTEKKVEGVVITFININKLKKTEKQLLDVEKKYQNLFENLRDGFFHAKIITDTNKKPIDWQYIAINPAFEKQTGYQRKTVIGKKHSDVSLVKSTGNIDWLQAYGHTALTGKDQLLKHYDSLQDKHYHVHIFCPKKGEFAATFSDVTQITKKEETLKLRTEELQKIQEITKVGSWVLDLKTNAVEWTKELYKMYLLDPSHPVPPYTEHQKFYTKESWEILSAALNKTTKTGIPYELELKTIRKDGSNGWIWVIGEAVKNERGEIVKLRGAAQDISERKKIQEELILAKKIAEDANSQKNHFVANMSHEIRTPMNAVIGFSELLKEKNLTEKEKTNFLKIIDNNSKQLLNLIDDIIDTAKIESGDLKIIESPCNIPTLLKELEQTYHQIKQSKNKNDIEFELKIPSEYNNLEIVTDKLRLKQVISNLLNNSLKFTEKGTISFGFNVVDNYVHFFVKDQGIGIPKEKSIEIFERFKQINYNEADKYEGTGLGLTICRGIVDLLGGTISFDSTLGVGTEFTVKIPLNRIFTKKEPSAPVYKSPYRMEEPTPTETTKNTVSSTTPPVAPPPPKPLAVKTSVPEVKETFNNHTTSTPASNKLEGKTVLIAEDERLIRIFFQQVFKKTNVHLIFALNGQEAINIYKEKHQEIDVVLMDIRMPIMNGFDAMQGILSDFPNTKIIVQSAFVRVEEKERALELGAVDYVTKPIVRDELLEKIQKWV